MPGQVLAPVVGAFGEMSSGMYGLADVVAAAMTEDDLQFFKGLARKIRGTFRQRVLRDWGHAAPRMGPASPRTPAGPY